MRKNEKGFGVVGTLIVIVVLGLIVTVGYLFFDRQKSKTNNSQTTISTVESVEQPDAGAQQAANEAEPTSNDLLTYENGDLGFSFSYPAEYGKVNEDAWYGTENENALRYTFYFENICPSCDTSNPFSVDMTSYGIVEIGATKADFGGIGIGRPYASSAGFSGQGNFDAVNVKGLLKTAMDEMHGTVITAIEFNLTKSSNATGIMFMTNDKPNETTNAENLKKIAKTFKLLP